jgi:hypothetical protein
LEAFARTPHREEDQASDNHLPREILLEAYEEIFSDLSSWDDVCQPQLIPDNKVTQIWGDELDACKLEAQSVAVSGYRLVLEDGPDLSDSSDEGNKPDEEFGMYTSGCSIDAVRLGGLEAFALRKSGGDPYVQMRF